MHDFKLRGNEALKVISLEAAERYLVTKEGESDLHSLLNTAQKIFEYLREPVDDSLQNANGRADLDK